MPTPARPPVRSYVAPPWPLKPAQLSPEMRAAESARRNAALVAAHVSKLAPKIEQARKDLREVREADAAAARRTPEAIVRATREALGESSPYFRMVLEGEARRLACLEHTSYAEAVEKLRRAGK